MNTSIIDLSNEKTFEACFKEYYLQLIRFAFQYVDDEQVAAEMVQEMFSNLWEKSASIQIRTSLKSYLYGAVRNACLNYLKHQKVKSAYAADIKLSSNQPNESNVLELDELNDRINMALDKIPSKCRQIFEMSRYEEKKYHEIAKELDLSIKTVENQMGKALKILREELQDYLILLCYLLMNGGI